MFGRFFLRGNAAEAELKRAVLRCFSVDRFAARSGTILASENLRQFD